MAKTKIYIYGASGHGKVVADIARDNGYEQIVFLDDFSGVKFSENLPKADIIIAIGNNFVREKLQEKVIKAGFNVVNLIHSSAVISPSAKFGQGIVVMPKAVINADAKINDGVIVNTGAVIEHECVLGEFSHISPNTALAGGVKIGARTHMGILSTAIQKIEIGRNCIIAAGAVVVRNIASNSLAMGVPAKIVRNFQIEKLLRNNNSVFVFYTFWEMECCGTPFKLRDKINWEVEIPSEYDFDKFCDEKFRIDLYHNSHTDVKENFTLTGVVKTIKKLYTKFKKISEKHYKAEKEFLFSATDTQQFEENIDDLKFSGYVVEIENFDIKK